MREVLCERGCPVCPVEFKAKIERQIEKNVEQPEPLVKKFGKEITLPESPDEGIEAAVTTSQVEFWWKRTEYGIYVSCQGGKYGEIGGYWVKLG